MYRRLLRRLVLTTGLVAAIACTASASEIKTSPYVGPDLAVADPYVAVLGKCCTDGLCEMLTESECEAQCGDFDPLDDCEIGGPPWEIPCGAVIFGACCVDAVCEPTLTGQPDACECAGGVYYLGKTCETVECLAKCCTDGHCEMLTEAACEAQCGHFYPAGDCDVSGPPPWEIPCPAVLIGVCCVDGVCDPTIGGPDSCECAGGEYIPGRSCETIECPGRCCTDGHCEMLTETECEAQCGHFDQSEDCELSGPPPWEIPCPAVLIGVCCVDGICDPTIGGPDSCECVGGDYIPGRSCETIECPGQCCTDGLCEMLTETECEAQCGNFDQFADCELIGSPPLYPCPLFVMGACCVDGVCDPTITGPNACECAGGDWFPGEDCETVECPGQCCTDGLCEMLTEAECEAQCGNFDQFADCELIGSPPLYPCPLFVMGACCVDAVCDPTITGPNACECAGGIWYPGEDCETFECPAKCCTDGVCEMLTEAECEAQCGHFYPTGDCDINEPWEIGCPMYLTGACCVDGVCDPTITGPNACECAGGIWYIGESCNTFECPAKCCTDGVCEMLTEAECEAQCGHFYPTGDCDINEPWEIGCPMYLTGACCVDGVCDPTITGPNACECAGGIWYIGESCNTFECPAKCCTDGVCEMLTEAECEAQCGHFYPTGDCDINEPWEIGCPMYLTGACCVDGVCDPTITGPNACECAGGIWYPGEDCQNFKCP